MQRISASLLIAVLLLGALGFTVYSQQGDDAPVEVQVLSGGINQQVPVDVTLLVSTETGVQTVTVPLNLNVNLRIGPVEAVDLSVELEPASQFVSPIAVVESVTSVSEMTTTETVTESDTVTE